MWFWCSCVKAICIINITSVQLNFFQRIFKVIILKLLTFKLLQNHLNRLRYGQTAVNKSKLAYIPTLRFPLKVYYSTFDVYTFCICGRCIHVDGATGPRADGLLDPGNDAVKQSGPTSFARVHPGKIRPATQSKHAPKFIRIEGEKFTLE